MWRTAKLGDVCEFQSGLWKGKKEPLVRAYVLRNTNFTVTGELSYENVAELDVELKQLMKRTLQFGDIILEKSGGGDKTPVGRVCVFEKASTDIPYSLSNFTSLVRVKDQSVLDYRFLHKVLYFMYIGGKTESMQRHTTGIRNLQLEQYKSITFPLPPLPEQQRIVAILNKAAKIERLRTRAQELMREFIPALFIKMFGDPAENPMGWETVKLGDVCKMYQPKTISIKEMKADGDYPVYGANGVIGRYDKYNHENPQLLVTCRGATCGSVNISAPFSWINGNAMVIQPDETKLSLHYMQYVFRDGIKLRKAITGTAQPQITRQSLKPLEFSCPPLEKQQQFTKIVESAHSASRLEVSGSRVADKLTASLMSRLLRDAA